MTIPWGSAYITLSNGKKAFLDTSKHTTDVKHEPAGSLTPLTVKVKLVAVPAVQKMILRQLDLMWVRLYSKIHLMHQNLQMLTPRFHQMRKRYKH